MGLGTRTIEVDEATVSNTDFIDIIFTMPYGVIPPIVTANVKSHNISVWISNLTSAGVRLNFSAKYTGTVYYQVIDKG